jgi:hypothetical protein
MELAINIAAGIAELVQAGIVSANKAKEAEDIMFRNMKATPSAKEIEDYQKAKKDLGI